MPWQAWGQCKPTPPEPRQRRCHDSDIGVMFQVCTYQVANLSCALSHICNHNIASREAPCLLIWQSPCSPRLRMGLAMTSRRWRCVDTGAVSTPVADRQTRARLSPLMDLSKAQGDGVAIDHIASVARGLRLPAPHPCALDNVLLLSRRRRGFIATSLPNPSAVGHPIAPVR